MLHLRPICKNCSNQMLRWVEQFYLLNLSPCHCQPHVYQVFACVYVFACACTCLVCMCVCLYVYVCIPQSSRVDSATAEVQKVDSWICSSQTQNQTETNDSYTDKHNSNWLFDCLVESVLECKFVHLKADSKVEKCTEQFNLVQSRLQDEIMVSSRLGAWL